MSWHWRLEDPSGAAVEPSSIGVEVADTDNQGDAESWLGETWRDLLAAGVAQVVLVEDDRVEYTMPLTPAEA